VTPREFLFFFFLCDGEQIALGGCLEWRRGGKRHRDNDQPALVWAKGSKEWWTDGERQNYKKWCAELEEVK